jgi:hypothetical protein
MSHHNHQHLEPLGIETAGCPFGAMYVHELPKFLFIGV